MSRLSCRTCGATFYPQSAAWGDETCGDCIAARIELGLRGPALLADRKPAKRAGDAAPPQTWPAQGELLAQRRA